MKNTLHFLAIAMLFVFMAKSNAEQKTLALRIIQTHMDDTVAISFDDGEYENDSIDKVDDDDLDMGWEGDDLNIMTSYVRFQHVTIGQASTIDSAFINLYAHEDEKDTALVKIYAEATDNSVMFSENEAIEDRTYTSEVVSWDITEPWTMWEPYRSPDLKTLIQAVIDRSGWVYGNSLTLFLQGTNQGAQPDTIDNARDWESFENIEDPEDGGDGLTHAERIPELVIYYQPNAAAIETTTNSEIAIYPNPATSGSITVDLKSSAPASISMFSVTGTVLKTLNVAAASTQINVADVPAGYYFIQVKQNNATETQKVIVK